MKGNKLSKKYKGYGSELYDSRAEAKASFRFAELGCLAAKDKFDFTFTDAEGTVFAACPDFYHVGADLYIEFKCAELNGTKSKASADRQLRSKEEFRRSRGESLLLIDRLKLQWNHATQKHAIVQRQLTTLNYMVVFDKAPDADEASKYIRAGVCFCPLKALPSYLAYARLRKLGWPVSFQLHYEDEETGKTVLTLGEYQADGDARVICLAS
jgi:hypothetical protein